MYTCIFLVGTFVGSEKAYDLSCYGLAACMLTVNLIGSPALLVPEKGRYMLFFSLFGLLQCVFWKFLIFTKFQNKNDQFCQQHLGPPSPFSICFTRKIEGKRRKMLKDVIYTKETNF
jgi:hypothetical protein